MTPGTPDDEVLARHLTALRTSLATLRQLAGVDTPTLMLDLPLRWSIERGLQLAAQNTLDVATHLLSSAGRDTDDYASSIDGLATLGILPPEFAARFRDMAGFRNVLVHAYLAIDLDVVVDVLNNRLEDFEAFAAHIEAATRA